MKEINYLLIISIKNIYKKGRIDGRKRKVELYRILLKHHKKKDYDKRRNLK